jgi:hypothetical protein
VNERPWRRCRRLGRSGPVIGRRNFRADGAFFPQAPSKARNRPPSEIAAVISFDRHLKCVYLTLDGFTWSRFWWSRVFPSQRSAYPLKGLTEQVKNGRRAKAVGIRGQIQPLMFVAATGFTAIVKKNGHPERDWSTTANRTVHEIIRTSRTVWLTSPTGKCGQLQDEE